MAALLIQACYFYDCCYDYYSLSPKYTNTQSTELCVCYSLVGTYIRTLVSCQERILLDYLLLCLSDRRDRNEINFIICYFSVVPRLIHFWHACRSFIFGQFHRISRIFIAVVELAIFRSVRFARVRALARVT